MINAALPAERYPFYYKLIFGVFVIGLPVALASQPMVFRDGDVSWHLAAGRWILEHCAFPHSDPFSFTMAGKPWLAIEWGAEVIYAWIYGLAGHAGIAAVVALAVMAINATLFWYLRPRAGPVALLLALAAFCLVFLPFIMARPHLLAWPIFALWTAVLLRARDRGGRPPWALLPLMVLWANIHGSFPFGFIVAAAVALDVMIATRWDRQALVRWLGFGLASVAASLLTPYGMQGFLHPFTISTMSNLPAIGEWRPSSPAVTPLFYLVLLAGLAGLLMARRAAFTAGELLLVLFSLAAAFWHVRHQAVFIVLAVFIVTPKLGRGPAGGAVFGSRREARLALGAAAAGAIAIFAVRAALPLKLEDGKGRPTTLIAHIPPQLRSQPVFNEYSFGGPLILAGVRPFIDGRADMYGDAFMDRYLKIWGGDQDAFDLAVREYGIAWTMLPPKSALALELDRSGKWKRIYGDEIGTIHVRANRRRVEPVATGGRG